MFDSMRQAVENELHDSIDRLIIEKNSELYQMLCYHMGWEGEGAGIEAQGKRIRPIISLLCASVIHPEWQKALPAAAAVELLHNFSLIHDDIQDKSLLRRGRPTVWNKWGVAQAINAGDTLFTMSHMALLNSIKNVNAEITIKAAKILHQTAMEITHGQYLDLSFEDKREVTLSSYLAMINGKTAALLGCSSELGAMMAGASSEQAKICKQFGISLGLAFQIQDDWLGIWGNSSLTGKSTESDILSRKKTLPILYALSQEGEFKNKWEKEELTLEMIPELVKLLENNGAQAYTQKMGDKLITDAGKALDQLNQNNEGMEALRKLINTLTRREK